jgi:glycosyltransferase involved in cell wall biosynthesis
MSLGNITGVTLSRRYRVPLVLEYNGSEAWVAKNWGRPLRFHDLAVAAEEVCLRHAHLVVTISDVLGEELERRGVSRERIVVYPNCIDPKMFDPARFSAEERTALRGSLGLSSGEVVATFVGTFGQWHGADVLARAIRTIYEQEPDLFERSGLRFVLVGDGQKMPLVREQLELPGLDRYVKLTGLVPQREAPLYLAASDILVSPHVANADGSAFFGSPTKLFEYMAMGKGIVASDLDQLGKVLSPAVRATELPSGVPTTDTPQVAVLCQPGDIAQLVAGIRFLAHDAQWRATLGANARREALGKYTWGHHVGAILAAADRLAGS